MLRSQDIVVLLKLACRRPGDWTFDGIAEELDLSSSAVHRSLDRAAKAGLYDARRRELNWVGLLEFLVHGAKWAFPPVRSGEARGIPTAWAAPPLAERLSVSGDGKVPVWPHALGQVRGLALEPLHRVVPEAVERDALFGELLTLLDAIRIGSPRERSLAAEELEKRLVDQAAPDGG